MFEGKEFKKEQLLGEILQDDTNITGYNAIWRTATESRTILFTELANEGLVKRGKQGNRVELTDLGIDVATKLGGYSKWKKDSENLIVENENRQKRDDELRALQLKKIKFDYQTRFLAVAAFVISLISIGFTIFIYLMK